MITLETNVIVLSENVVDREKLKLIKICNLKRQTLNYLTFSVEIQSLKKDGKNEKDEYTVKNYWRGLEANKIEEVEEDDLKLSIQKDLILCLWITIKKNTVWYFSLFLLL